MITCFRVLWRQTTPAVIPGESPWNVNEVWCCDILSMLLKKKSLHSPAMKVENTHRLLGISVDQDIFCSTVWTSCFLFFLLLFLFVSLECRFSYIFPQWRRLRTKHTHTHSVQPAECALISCMGWRRWGPQSLSLCVQMVVSVTLLWLIRPCRGPVGQTCWLNRDRVYVTKKTHTHTRSVLSGKVSWWMALRGRRPLESIIWRHWSDRLAASDGASASVTDLSRPETCTFAHPVVAFQIQFQMPFGCGVGTLKLDRCLSEERRGGVEPHMKGHRDTTSWPVNIAVWVASNGVH